MRNEEIMQFEPYTLIEYLSSEYLVEVPDVVASIADMSAASELLLKLGRSYSYITSLLSYAKIEVRNAKREASQEKDNGKKEELKQEYDDLVDKKEIIVNVSEAIKQQYSAISRAVTIHIENNKELNMAAR